MKLREAKAGMRAIYNAFPMQVSACRLPGLGLAEERDAALHLERAVIIDRQERLVRLARFGIVDRALVLTVIVVGPESGQHCQSHYGTIAQARFGVLVVLGIGRGGRLEELDDTAADRAAALLDLDDGILVLRDPAALDRRGGQGGRGGDHDRGGEGGGKEVSDHWGIVLVGSSS